MVYDLDIDSYNGVGFIYDNLSDLEYIRLQAYQYYSNIQVFFPLPFYSTSTQDANLWYHLAKKEYIPLLTPPKRVVKACFTKGMESKRGNVI